MFDVRIYLKSGQVVEFTTKELGMKKNALGGLESLTWTTNSDREKFSLNYIELEQIAAITAFYRDGDTDGLRENV
jgi:hypothetical protein